MYSNLIAEMVRAGYNKQELAKETGIHYNTLRDKLSDRTEFKINEMVKIQKILNEKNNTNNTIDYLFKK